MPKAAPIHRRKVSGIRTHGGNRQKTRALATSSREWLRLRQVILLRDAYTCRACGGIGNQVDHIDGDSHNNNELNLQVLCGSCHSSKTAKDQSRGR